MCVEWKDKNVLITGATGFVGSWLTKALVERGANVIIFVRDHVPATPLKYMGIYNKVGAAASGDITVYNSIRRVFNEYEIDTCFHLAAQTIVGVANRSPVPTFETNIKGTWNILEAARNSETIKRVVVASTDKVYGEPKELPITEQHPLLAAYPYDASKACMERLCGVFVATYGLPIVITRCCNIYGGGDLNFSRIIPGTIRSVLFNERPIIRSDGSPVRDFIHVDDVVSAYITSADSLAKEGVLGEAFNFGSNAPIDVLSLVKKIIEISGKALEPEILGKGAPKAEISRQYLSNEKANRILGWEPRVGLEEGLRRTIEWYATFFNS